MTQKQARRLIKIGKYIFFMLVAVVFVVMIIQGIMINNLKTIESDLLAEYNNKSAISTELENQVTELEDLENFNKYSEEELRKDNYVKKDEILFTAK